MVLVRFPNPWKDLISGCPDLISGFGPLILKTGSYLLYYKKIILQLEYTMTNLKHLSFKVELTKLRQPHTNKQTDHMTKPM